MPTPYAWPVLVIVAACLVMQAAAGDTVEVGVLTPLTGANCASGAQYRRAVEAAVTYVNAQSWWSNTQSTLRVNVMDSNSSFLAFTNAQSFTSAACTPEGGTGSCFRAGMVGPFTSDATLHVAFVARKQRMPLVAFSATSKLLSDLQYFARVCPNDLEGAQSLYKLIKHFGWKQVAVLHVNNEYARAYELQLQNLVQDGDDLSIGTTVRFDAGNAAQLQDALDTIKDSLTRVIVLLGDGTVVPEVFQAAAANSMIGKGWTWLGAEWVSKMTFQMAPNAALWSWANGVVGSVASQGSLSTYDSGSLATFTATASNIADCPILAGHSSLAAAVYTDYAFDAVLSLASAVASLRGCSAPGSCTRTLASLTPDMVFNQLLTGPIQSSPLTGALEFDADGERVRQDVHVDMVNVQNPDVKVVGVRTAASEWELSAPVVWPGGGTEVPSDRSLPDVGTVAGLFSVALVAMAISLVLGYSIQTRSWINWFPSSGVVVLVGIVIGTIVKLLDSTIANEYEQAIKFDSEFFSLVFLPIIIFQSGYSLKKHPFFSQLGSILLFATVGTIVSTFAIGGILFHLGQADITTRMSMEESLSFGALISAVDPVSTLAQFGSIKVPLSLGALVYGESVINDAVSIVLYRTFTSFMTEEVSTGAIFLAALAVVGVLAGSVLIGFVLACLAGFTLRILNLDAIRGVHTEVAETGILVVYSYAAFTMTEAAHLSGIVASLSCGISMNHYLKKVLSKKGLALSVSTFMVMADIAETIVFLQVGLNVPLFADAFSFSLVAFTLLLCLGARLINVFPLSYVLNLGRKEPIPVAHQAILWLSGLRGAIAYALAVQFPSHLVAEVTNTTALVVVFTILVLGGSTRPAIRLLNIEVEDKPPTHEEEVEMNRKAQSSSKFKAWLAAFDARVIRRFVQGPLAPKPRRPPRTRTGRSDTVHESPLHTALDSSGDDDLGASHSQVELTVHDGNRRQRTSSAPAPGSPAALPPRVTQLGGQAGRR